MKSCSYAHLLPRGAWQSLLSGSFWLGLAVVSHAAAAPAQTQEPSGVQESANHQEFANHQESANNQEPGSPTGQQPHDAEAAGSINGSVSDSTGAVVAGAQVTLLRAGQPAQETLSDENGQFSFINLVPGSFEIRIVAAGFAPQSSSGVVHAAEAYVVPRVHLAPATRNIEIEVGVTRVELAEAQVKAAEKQRIFGVVPNFYVTYFADAVPLTARQKFELAWKSTIDPVTFALTGLTAGVEQAQNSFPGYGQGSQGYAKRFGALYADNITSTFIGSALLPALLKQDPRYFYKGTGGRRSRVLYAIANAVICKGDNGRWQPNYSAIVGGFASGALSNLYYPAEDRGAGLVFENTLIGTGETAVLNVVQEFFIRKLTPHVPKDEPPQH